MENEDDRSSETDEGPTRGRTRSHSLYGPDGPAPMVPSSPVASGAQSASSSPAPRRQRSRSLRSGDSIGDGRALDGSHTRRRSGSGRSHGAPGGKGGLSKKTLNIVNNLSSQAPSAARKDKDKEEEEEERRLAMEEKRRQGMGAGLYGSKDADCDYQIRILLLGDSGVGKTSLMLRYSEDEFAVNLLSTAGVDFKVRHLNVDGKRVKCQVWDTAGQEKFHVITRTYYKGAHGIALIYDVTDPDSFKNVNYWMANIQQHADEKVLKVLLGNKTDLPGRQITAEQGETVAKEFDLHFFETSAKDGTNVAEGFEALATEIVRRLEAQAQAESSANNAASAAATGAGATAGGKGHGKWAMPAAGTKGQGPQQCIMS